MPYLENEDFYGLDSLVKVTGNSINKRITVVAPDGVVIADSKNDPDSLENHSNRPEIISALRNGSGSNQRYSSTMNKEMLYHASTLKKGSRTIAVVRISVLLEDINSIVDLLLSKILNVTVLVIFVSFILIFLFSRTLTKPLILLTNASRSVAEGNFNIKVDLKNRDEFKELSDSFNYMTGHIKSLFDQLSMQKEELGLIINSVQEGFLVLDMNGKVILYNKGFEAIINNNQLEGKYYKELVTNKEFTKLIKKTIKKKKSSSDEIGIGDSFYLCSSNYLEVKNEVVMVFYNITELKKLEKIKKDFVSNVSHELRTPLTAIKGFIETMQDEIQAFEKDTQGTLSEITKFKRYLDIIDRHTNRLINIVRDLLMLSKFEDTMTFLELSEIDIYQFIPNVTKIFDQKLNEKKLYLKCSIGNNIPLFTADSFKLEQLFINLIDNSIKYTDEGGISLDIRSTKTHLGIIIADTGIGIPPDDIDRIFERFYTVDKSRSRKMGGTGLGLSIVKHIVLLHNGDIQVESNPGKGTSFGIKIPLVVSI